MSIPRRILPETRERSFCRPFPQCIQVGLQACIGNATPPSSDEAGVGLEFLRVLSWFDHNKPFLIQRLTELLLDQMSTKAPGMLAT